MNLFAGQTKSKVEGKARIEGAKRQRAPENRGRSPSRISGVAMGCAGCAMQKGPQQSAGPREIQFI